MGAGEAAAGKGPRPRFWGRRSAAGGHARPQARRGPSCLEKAAQDPSDGSSSGRASEGRPCLLGNGLAEMPWPNLVASSDRGGMGLGLKGPPSHTHPPHHHLKEDICPRIEEFERLSKQGGWLSSESEGSDRKKGNTKRRKENPNPAKDLTAVLAKVSFLLPEVPGQNPEERKWISCRKEGGVWAFFALCKRLESLKAMVCHCPGSATTLRGCLPVVLGCESESRSAAVSHSLRPHGLYSLWNSPGQETGVGSCSLLQGIFPTQGSKPGLLHGGRILYQLSHKGSRLLKDKRPFKEHPLAPRRSLTLCPAPVRQDGMERSQEDRKAADLHRRLGFLPAQSISSHPTLHNCRGWGASSWNSFSVSLGFDLSFFPKPQLSK
ncbi:uncharacterized protein LOC122451288 [Cervus canadensis]|uniref:uncharacterized protein LOC122451288 n=1 Tax=Cervus canadensis TaxID=1574408 RepID=UPI001C9E37D7|nr:uncharacterized protein LOC122451288 [Cervus canadensis]XP_043339931.1 uncharacterized protein LOC122451288 [Cervus canadensis]XP_043339932.1 uncharacterized protein LOC122451288 [Cervus canadensis]XP_043339933.1 uncharacterized protein LOC122451288 [Cervus canadensis]XP_043339934.1 uncharacterized protein LOC122451288 [Cervus canadensis]XP_043339935.1 uncharacterized protein LOC122451288 [Cervus canadensis]XP_043339936.1 uncharacterized protein LOC122451288 [Cervus canadensis]XP_04333993